MRELHQILGAFEMLTADAKPAALATVIAVNGSAYRRPGARMLVAADGRTWGGISGGCLERDVSRRARNVLATGTPIVCTYDTSDELSDSNDELSLLDAGRSPGAALGCRGVIDIFIEPVSEDRPGPMPLIRRCMQMRQAVLQGTVVRASSGSDLRVGQRIDAEPGEEPGHPELRRYEWPGGEWAEVFVETIRPPQSLVVFGGGSDVVPMVELAHVLGWHVTVAVSRNAPGSRERFALADAVVLVDPEHPTANVPIERGSAVVLMTHDVHRDREILRELVHRPLRYVGVLGPRSRTEDLLNRLPPGSVRAELFYPVGLDIGADQPELIAMAILAEIQCVLSGRSAGSLRDRTGPIYPPTGAVPCDPIS